MVFALTLRWGLGLLVAALAAFLVRIRPDLLRLPQLVLQSSPEPSSRTYCYQGIKTLFEAKPSARCFTVSGDGHFTRVFTPGDDDSDDVRSLLETAEKRTGYVIPGLWDGHGHLIQYGEFLHSVDLFGSSSAGEVRRRLREYVAARSGMGARGEWVRGFGWDQMALGEMPTAALLEEDEQLRGLYVMVDRVDGHCMWVSQAVLDLLPPDALERDVPGGEIVRNPGLGVFCDNAMELVTSLWPRPDPRRRAQFIHSAMRSLNRVGLVGMHDAGAVPEDLQLFQQLSHDSLWTLRVYSMIECKERNTFCPEDAAELRQQQRDSELLSIRSVKLFADGALGSWGSAMLEPYSDRPDTTGSLLVDSDTLTALALNWSAAGYQVNIHAIGDRANRLALDALEAALIDLCPGREPAECQRGDDSGGTGKGARFRIEHAQIVHPHDQARLHALGILPSVQPTHATSDMAYAETRLGRARLTASAYRMRSFFPADPASAPPPVLGSDFPIEPPDPFQGVYAAVARRSPHTGLGAGGAAEAWYPAEALTLDQALAGFTRGPAFGAFLEGRAGVIREGAFADWVVLDLPIEGYGLDDLRTMSVKETWVGGRLVYNRG